MLAFLANAAIYVVPFLVVITVIVTIHELGHFLTARAFGVAIDRFSIGFGRAIVSLARPLGRRVAHRLAAARRLRAVRRRRERRQRAGPGRSGGAARAHRRARGRRRREALLLLQAALAARPDRGRRGRRPTSCSSIALFAILFGTFGEPVASAQVAEVLPGSPAARGRLPAGRRRRPRPTARASRSFETCTIYVQYRAGVPIDFTVAARRPAGSISSPRPGAPQVDSPFGGDVRASACSASIAPQADIVQRYGPIAGRRRAARHDLEHRRDAPATTSAGMVTGQVGADQLHGFIGIAHVSGAITKEAVDARADRARQSGARRWLVQSAQLARAALGQHRPGQPAADPGARWRPPAVLRLRGGGAPAAVGRRCRRRATGSGLLCWSV